MKAELDRARQQRAEARRRLATVRKTTLGAADADLGDVRGEEGIALAARLTRAAWSLSGAPWPRYARSETPYVFVRWADRR